MPPGTPHPDPPEPRRSLYAARTPGNSSFLGVRVLFIGARATAGSILWSVAACTSRHSRIRRTAAGPAPRFPPGRASSSQYVGGHHAPRCLDS